ncbi:MAG: hypothetical protein EHM70_18395, partial [Chloroflexota bacterium]
MIERGMLIMYNNNQEGTPMPDLCLYWLGSPRIEYNGHSLRLEMRKTLALLAYLSLSPQSSSRETIATLFWPEYDQQHALSNLRRNLSSLSKSLPFDLLESDRDRIGLRRGDNVQVDVDQFRNLLVQANVHIHPSEQICRECIPPVEKAVALYRGDFFQGFTLKDCPEFDEWQFFQREGLQAEYAGALEKLAVYYQETREWEKAIAHTRSWLALDRLHEPAQRMLMLLYLRSGQRTAALRQYAECQQLLDQELGQSPQPETLKIYQDIRSSLPAGAPQQPRQDPLLRTKLRLPFIRLGVVPRPELQARIAAGLQFPLTLVVAPAGFGKTTLVAAALTGSRLPVAWLSLDKDDNQAGRFLKYLIAGLQGADSRIGSEAAQLISGMRPMPLQVVLASLINDLDITGREIVLVMEDYHFISSQDVHEAVAFFLEHCPHTLHLVIVSRSDPPLPLARLRARSQLVELRIDDLRFTGLEATQFLNDVMGLHLDAGLVAVLEERTEGWIAGLQMAALSMRDRDDVRGFIEGFSGTNRYILDYLLEEVLNSQPPEIQRFLLYTSILERLTAPLCDAVTVGAGSQATLERLERANLFVSSLDDERHWYRYHHLFSDLLQARLQQSQPELLPGLHARAADWYEDNGLAVEAINHALAGKHWSRAADLIEQQAMGSISGESVMALISWLEALPEEHLYTRPWLCVFRAWSLLLNCQVQGVENLLQRAEQNLPATDGLTSNEDVLGNVAMIRAYKGLFEEDLERAAEQVALADNLLPQNDRIIRCDLLWVRGFLPFLRGDLVRAADAWVKARDYSVLAENPYVTVTATGQLARVYRMQGRLRTAKELYQQALEVAANRRWQHSRLTTFVKKDLADVYRECNELTRATILAQEAAEETERWGNPSDAAMAQAILAHILGTWGQWDSSRQALNRAVQLCRNHATYPEIRSRIIACQVRLWLMGGDLPSALRWVEESHVHPGDLLDFRLEIEHIALARVLLSQNQSEKAAPFLARLDDAARIGGRNGSRIEILVLQAQALQACGDTHHALAALSTALALAEPEGYARIFLDEGQPMKLLLAQWLAHSSASPLRDYAVHLLAQFDAKEHSLRAAQEQAASTGELAEPLSQRELEVLQ